MSGKSLKCYLRIPKFDKENIINDYRANLKISGLFSTFF